MRIITLILISFLFLNADMDIFEQVKNDIAKKTQQQNLREKEFLKSYKNQKKLLKDEKNRLKINKNKTKKLLNNIKELKSKLQLKHKQLENTKISVGNLYDIFIKESQELYKTTKPISNIFNYNLKPLENILNNNQNTPDINSFKWLWMLMLDRLNDGGKIATKDITVIEKDKLLKKTITTVGDLGFFSDKYYYIYNQNLEHLESIYPKQDNKIIVDSTNGKIFNQLKQQKSFLDRVKQGGIVGYLIIGVGIIGFIFGFIKWIYLFYNSFKINKQKNNISNLKKDNFLGELLLQAQNKYKDDEALMLVLQKELYRYFYKIEFGHGFVKLIAAIAPLMGLLGTVLGMIITLDTITIYGNSDVSLLSNGISQALVTTMLGLIVAIVMLFIHMLLSSKANIINEILEEQSAALLIEYKDKNV